MYIKSNLFAEFCQDHEITIKTSAPHSPFSNGISERSVGLVKESIRLLTKQTSTNWPETLEYVTIALNNRNLKCGYSPEMLMFGSELETNKLLRKSDFEHNNEKDYLKELTKHLSTVRNKYLEKRKQINDQSNKNMNKHRIQSDFKAGQTVTVRNFNIAKDSGGAELSKYQGPFIIDKVFPDENICFLTNIHNGRTKKAHFMHLRKYEPNNQIAIPVPVKCSVKPKKSIIQPRPNHSYGLRARKNV